MEITRLNKITDVFDILKTQNQYGNFDDIDIETNEEKIYITSEDTKILTVFENVMEFNVADDYVVQGTRYIKISIPLS